MIQLNIDIHHHVTVVTSLQITLAYDKVPTIKMPEKREIIVDIVVCLTALHQ